MTDMKRLSISLPDDLAAALEAVKQKDEFKDKSYSELIRIMIQRGLTRAAADEVA